MIERFRRMPFVKGRWTLCSLLLATALAPCEASGQVPQAERDALIAIYNATNGAGWAINDGWLGEPGTECSWFGVNCSGDPNGVTSLALQDNGLSGSIPTAIGDLTALENFNLEGNDLAGDIPLSIGNLTNLRNLQLPRNRLTGPIPATIGNLTDLQSIFLYANRMSGALPDGLWSLSSLQTLIIHGNAFGGPISPAVGSASSLTTFRAFSCGFTGSIPAEIGNLLNLEELWLSDNDLTGPIPSSVENLEQLQYLDLASNDLSGQLPAGIGGMTSLVELHLSDNPFGGTIPKEIGNLTQLEILNLSVTGMTGSIPAELGNLAQLEQLLVSSDLNRYPVGLSGPIPAELGSLTKLTHIQLGGNQLTGPVPWNLSSLSQARQLSFWANQLDWPPSVLQEVSTLTNLVEIDFGHQGIEGTLPPEWGNLTQLQHILLYGNALTGGLPEEFGELSNLKTLALSGNRLTGEIPASVGNLRELQYFAVDGCKLSGRIPSELGNLTQLEDLVLEANLLTGPMPSSLAALTNVTELNLSFNGLSAGGASVKSWADARQPNWHATQTVAPTNLQFSSATDTSVTLSWTPIEYQGGGGRYEVLSAGAVVASTNDKGVGGATVSGLQPGARYALAVRTVTGGGSGDPDSITSEPTPELEVTTTSTPEPNVTLTKAPEVITIVADGVAVDSTTLSIANLGNAPSEVTLTPTGGFFTLSEVFLTLPGGASATLTITALPRSEVAELRGSVGISGDGVPAGLAVEVKVFAAPAPPVGSPLVIVETTRVDVSAPAGENPTGSVTFRNIGNARATGVLGADQPWIVPEPSVKVIEPGATAAFTFVIDRARRPDAQALAGSQQGTLVFVYVAGAGGAFGRDPLAGAPTLATPIKISDTVKPADKGACAGICVNGIPLLNDGEVGLVVPGLGNEGGEAGTFVSDVTIYNRGFLSITDLALYFSGKAVDQPVAATTAVALADVTRTAFDDAGVVGALHLRSGNALRVAMTASVVSRSEPSGTFGSDLPVFRTDRAAESGETITIPGVGKNSTTTCRLYIQEVRGADAVARVDFLDGAGGAVGVVPSRLVPAFGLAIVDESEVPDGVVTVRVTASGAGSIVAYATIVDRAGKDTSIVADWGQVYEFSPTDAHALAVAGTAPGRNGTYFQTAFAIHGLRSGDATLRYYPRTPKISAVEKVVTLGAGETEVYDDVVSELFGTTLPSIGYVEVVPSSGMEVKTSSRTYTTKKDSTATLGTGVPMLPEEAALRIGQSIVFGGLEDSTFDTASAGTPATFRTNIGLVEVGGSAVKVRVSILLFDGTQLAVGGTTASRDYDLAPREWNQLNGIVDEIVGREIRKSVLGELSNVQVRVQVVEGEGSVIVYSTQTDNGSGDTTIRFE